MKTTAASHTRKLSKLDSGGGGIGTQASIKPGDTMLSEKIRKLETDFRTVSKRLSDLQNPNFDQLQQFSTNSSSYVSSVRGMVESYRGMSPSNSSSALIQDDEMVRLQLMDAVLSKLGELDREVLRKTDLVNVAKARRNSPETELNLLPAHMQVIDRLQDFYIQILRLSDGGNNNATDEKNTAIRTQLEAEIRETKDKLTKAEVACKNAQKMYQESQQEVDRLIKSQQQARSPRGELSIIGQQQKPNELEIYKANLVKSENARKSLEDRIEQLCSQEESFVSDIMAMSQDVKQGAAPKSITSTVNNNSSEKVVKALNHLKNSISGFISSQAAMVTNASSVQNSNMERLLAENSNLRKEINSLEDLLQKNSQQFKKERDALCKQLNESEAELLSRNKRDAKVTQDVDKKIHDLQNQLAEYQQNNLDFEMMTKRLTELQLSLLDSDDKRRELELTLNGIMTENSSIKALNESLKKKIKELTSASQNHSGKSDEERKNFMDTFEEVMRDELYTMKKAFESKLQATKTELEEASRRHQNEILKIQTTLNKNPSKPSFTVK